VYAKAIACTDEAEQIALYKELQAILSENAANVYIQDLCDLVATAPNLKGYEFYPIYVMDMSTVHYIK
ncbi:MAG: ABC transporter substrate-binding protein, partial [Oscillospiraceae bacterium]|nr:ABC transporter substrate-binding protein [Oscillospiraceae bacterium]